MKRCAQIPVCVLQMDCRLSAFTVLKLWLDEVYTVSAVKRFISFLVSGLCTGAYSAVYHLPCSGMCLGASFKPHDEHGKLLLTLGKKKGTHRRTHAFCFCRQDCNERINCSPCILLSSLLTSCYCPCLVLFVKCGEVSKLEHIIAITSSSQLVDADM